MGRVCGPRLGGSKALLETGRRRFPEAGAGRIGPHTRGGNGGGRGFEPPFRGAADRPLPGAGAGALGGFSAVGSPVGGVSRGPPEGGPPPGRLPPVPAPRG